MLALCEMCFEVMGAFGKGVWGVGGVCNVFSRHRE